LAESSDAAGIKAMRDNHLGLPELLTAHERGGHYFAEIAVTVNGETRSFEIGLTREAYHSFKAITSLRPFDTMPGLEYRYFFVPSIGRTPDSSMGTTHIRIEQGQNGQEVEVEAPVGLISNLMWFFELKDFSAASHLRETTRPGQSQG
jgi:hypothetical protein